VAHWLMVDEHPGRPAIRREKMWAMLGFLGLAWLASAAMLVANLVAAISDPGSWSGFVIMLATTLAISGLIVAVRKGFRPQD
jgi:hypothetical protein